MVSRWGRTKHRQGALAVERAPGGFEQDDPASGNAAQALAALDRAAAFWQGVLQELPTASWWEPLGAVAGPFAEDDKASLVPAHALRVESVESRASTTGIRLGGEYGRDHTVRRPGREIPESACRL